ncbi:DUF2254 domain-containing protein [Streptosporangium sp. NPDC004379]|uniref:DUF2254 domain-containing protein n=1 Tax=Streptosporangium sp. NPDC004379 TaxID=3366189 RepID=UPI00369DF9A2
MDLAGRLRRWWGVRADAWRTRLWPIPVAGVALAAVLGVVLPRLDARLDDELPPWMTAYLFTGGPEAARTVLSAIAGSLITVTSLTFSLTVVTLQLASSQYSPRLLRTFVQDRFVHVALALLLATFVYSLTVLRTVRASAEDRSAFVPQLSVTVAYLLALAGVIALVAFLAHLARQIRVESLLRVVHAEADATIARNLPEEDGGEDEGTTVPSGVPPMRTDQTVPLCARSSGFLTSVDEEELLAAAVDAGAVVLLRHFPGDSVVAGIPIAAARPLDEGAALDPETVGALSGRVAEAVGTGYERTAAQDVAFGLRQIVDVALKALSPGINDPTTAVHALGHVAALVCDLARRDLGPRLLRDDSGRVRVVLRRPGFPMLLDLAITQPRRYGTGDPEVLARLFTMLREVAWSTHRPEHHRAVADQLVRLCTTADTQGYDREEAARMGALARSVREALAGRWPPDAGF